MPGRLERPVLHFAVETSEFSREFIVEFDRLLQPQGML
jgi:hypothetical protein